jgi:GH18 family chitinase
MTYDYHGQWDKITGHVAPMYPHPDDIDTTFNAVSKIYFSSTKHHIYFDHLRNYLTSIKKVKECSLSITALLHVILHLF